MSKPSASNGGAAPASAGHGTGPGAPAGGAASSAGAKPSDAGGVVVPGSDRLLEVDGAELAAARRAGPASTNGTSLSTTERVTTSSGFVPGGREHLADRVEKARALEPHRVDRVGELERTRRSGGTVPLNVCIGRPGK